MAKLNWNRANTQDRMRRNGYERGSFPDATLWLSSFPKRQSFSSTINEPIRGRLVFRRDRQLF